MSLNLQIVPMQGCDFIFAVVTARKRSLRKGNIFTRVCHSVHRGCQGACMVGRGVGGCVWLLGGVHGYGGHVWLPLGHAWLLGACMVARGTCGCWGGMCGCWGACVVAREHA